MARNIVERLGLKDKHFSNWAGTYSCTPEVYFEPETTDDIRQILDYAREKGKKVKAVGCGHSPSDLACTTDVMISLARYNKVLNINKEKLQVTAQGGCLMQELNENVLPSHGMAFSVQGAVSDLTVAGVISTGTHGTGLKFPNLSAFVVSLEIMLASGEVKKINHTENTELLPIVSLCLGSLGVILSVTFQCEKAFNLRVKQFPNTLKNVVENLSVYNASSDHFRMNWYPHTDSVTCFTYNRTTEEPTAKTNWFWDNLIGYHLFELILWVSTFWPTLIPKINKLHFALLGSREAEKIDRSDRIFNFNCLFKQYVMEWAVPIEKTGIVLYELQEWIYKSNFPSHLPVEIRFVKGDNNYLSPCYERDCCYINILMYRPYGKSVPHETYWDEYQRIVAKHGGRPHWAKNHKFTAAQFKEIYPKWNNFCAVRKQLDPTGMFLNDNLNRVFNESPADV